MTAAPPPQPSTRTKVPAVLRGVARPVLRRAKQALRATVRTIERRAPALVNTLAGWRLPTWLVLPLAHELTDPAPLERIIGRTSRWFAPAEVSVPPAESAPPEKLAPPEQSTPPERAAATSGSHPSPSRGQAQLHEVALLRRARLALDARDDRNALQWFQQAHRDIGPTAATWTWLAVTLRRLGQLESSRDAGEQALRLDPHWGPALAHLGILYQQLGQRPHSVHAWQQLLDTGTATPDELRWAWIGLTRARELERALAAATQLADYTRQSADARAMMAVSLHELGRHDQAADLIDTLRRTTGDDAIRAVAFYQGRTGASDSAYTTLQQLPVARRGRRALLELIYALREDGHLRLARDAANDAVAALPDDAEIRQARDLADGVVRVFEGSAPTPRPPLDEPDRLTPVASRVLHVVGRTVPYTGSGYAVRTDHTVRAQRAIGIDAQVVSQLGFPWEDGHEPAACEDVNGVPHHRLAIPPDARLPLTLAQRLEHNIDALSALVETLQPSVLHAASDFRNGVLAVEVGSRFGIPVVYEMRGFWEETWLAKHGEHAMDRDVYQLRRIRELEVATRAAHVVTLAPTMRDALIERGVDPNKISLAPNAVDPHDFPPMERDEGRAAELGIGPEDLVVGYLSSFVGYEGIHVLIDAIAHLRHTTDLPVKCLLVGDGIVRPELERQTRDLDIEHDVIFTGRVPHTEVSTFYGLMDIFVVPRTNARVCRLVSPLKPYEAMATARTMVVSATPVLCDIVDDGVTGRTFEPENAHDLARTIGELAADPAQRDRLRQAAREQVLDQHTWQRNAHRYAEVYRQLG